MTRLKAGLIRRAIVGFLFRSVTLLGAAVVYPLSLRSVRRLGNAAGHLAGLLPGRRKRVAEANLTATFGEALSAADRRRIRLRAAQNLCKTVLELFKAPSLGPEGIRKAVPAQGTDKIRDALAKGKGVILLSPHLGNWEMIAARLAADGFDMAVVARDASDAAVASLMNRCRDELGVRVLARDNLREMLLHLRNGGCLGLAPDLHAKDGSILLSFLGRPAWVPRGPALLAMRSGCPLTPVVCVRKPDDSLEMRVLDEVEIADNGSRGEAVAETMRRVNSVLEAEIRKRPDQWMWFHNRWKQHNRSTAQAKNP